MISNRKYIILLFGMCLSLIGYSQVPFNGLIVEEIPIPLAIAADIVTEHNATGVVMADPSLEFQTLPRCWRVYACLSEQDWELQAIFGLDDGVEIAPLELTTTTAFYQNSFGSTSGLRLENPALFPFFPNYPFDSWFTIGSAVSPPITKNFINSGAPLTDQFEANKSGFLVNDATGGAIFSTQFPPGVPGVPSGTGEILIAQFTSDGLINGNLNFQFRRLLPDGNVFPGPVVVKVRGIPMDLTPGVLPDVCSIQFLNVDLLSFNAVAKQDKVDLQWETLSERNSSHFVVERSQNLVDWQKVNQLQGAGTIEQRRYYITSDEAPLLGTTYYRLTQFDNNGDFEHFDLKSVFYEGRREIQVYPNPAKESTNITGLADDVSSIELLNGSGQLVLSFTPQQSTIEQLNTSGLQSGIYLIKIIYRNGTVDLKKLVVKH